MDCVSDPFGFDAPSPGDLTVCLKCGAVMELSANLTCIGLTREKVEKVQADTKLMNAVARLVKAVHFVMALHERRN